MMYAAGDSSKRRRVSSPCQSFVDACRALRDQVEKVPLEFHPLEGLEDRLRSQLSSGQLTPHHLQMAHRWVSNALEACETTMDKVGDVAREETRGLEQEFRREAARLSITWKEDQEDEDDVVRDLKNKMAGVVGAREPNAIEKEVDRVEADIQSLTKDIRASEGLMLQSDRGRDGLMKIVNELQAELNTAKGKLESLKEARQSVQAFAVLKPIADALKRAREQRGQHRLKAENVLEHARKAWCDLRRELYDKIVKETKTLLLYDPSCIRHPGNNWEKPERVHEVEGAFKALRGDAYKKVESIDQDQYYPLYLGEDDLPGGGYTEEVRGMVEVIGLVCSFLTALSMLLALPVTRCCVFIQSSTWTMYGFVVRMPVPR